MTKNRLYGLFLIFGLLLSCGCTKSDMSLPSNIPQLFIPTAFTPNGDGVNDTFKIVSAAPLTYYSISIYDKNNIMVYQNNDINKGWDGTYEESPEATGSYLWAISYQAEGTKVAKMNGSVELIR